MKIQEIWPGPMEGIGRNGFIRAATGLRLVERWMTPFIRVTGSVPAAGKLFRMVEEYLSGVVPVTIQIMGNDPEALGECAAKLLAFPHVEGINLNCGCPSLRVVRHHSGGGMLCHPEKLAEFCRKIAVFLPPEKLSVKVRSGFENPDDMEIFLPELSESGVISKIFFHYRTVTEMYSSSPLPERVNRIARAVKLCGDVPVIANGDISSVSDGESLVAATGAAGIMIARPWMRDPFLLRRFRDNLTADEETGRQLFMAELRREGIRGGALIELAKMLWGSKSEHFRQIMAEEGY